VSPTPRDGTPCKTCGGSGGWFTGERMADSTRLTPERRADMMGCVRLVETSPDTRGETRLAAYLRDALVELDAVVAQRDAARTERDEFVKAYNEDIATVAALDSLTVAHAESIEYVVAMLDQIAPRSGGADNRVLAREAAQIIRKVARE
jgi:hypothetical protein